MDFANYWFQEGPGGTTIGNSLRFRGGQYLQTTTYQNNSTFTTSAWVKIGNPSQNSAIWGACATSGANNTNSVMRYQTTHAGGNPVPAFAYYVYDNNDTAGAIYPGSVRDTSAWYHIVVQKEPGTHQKMWINNIPNKTYTPNWADLVGQATYRIGNWGFGTPGAYFASFDGYIADFHHITGTALGPEEFGEYDANGVWVPKKYTGTYGTNGFFLDFSDPADIGADRSGNGNNFTPTGFIFDEAHEESGSDWAPDSPTINQTFLFNQLGGGVRQSGGGDTTWYYNSNAQWNNARSGYAAIPTSGKWWIEWRFVNGNTRTNVSVTGLIAIKDAQFKLATYHPGYSAGSGYGWYNPSQTGSSTWYDNGVGTDISPGVSPNTTPYLKKSKIGFAIDCDAATPTIQLWQNDVNDHADTAGWTLEATETISREDIENGLIPVFTPYYGNGSPSFYQTCPAAEAAGYKLLDVVNFPAVPIPDGRDHFQAITDTGANILTAAQTAFPNGLWWIKDRANANQHQLVDSASGKTIVGQNSPGGLKNQTYVAPTGDSVAWCWSAPEAFTDTNGSVTTTGYRNTAAGFSTFTYTGTGQALTIGTGLATAPGFIIVTNLDRNNPGNSYLSIVWCEGLGLNRVHLQSNIAQEASVPWFFDETPGTTNPGLIALLASVSVGAENMNCDGQTHLAHVWTPVPGYSAFGTYTGNGNADGPFIYTGFRPAFVLLKNNTGANPWSIYDSSRNLYNPVSNKLYPSGTGSENNAPNGADPSSNLIDFLSNGFKFRTNSGNTNFNTASYIYAAFAENPFGGSNVSPANAR